jgi:hypothetical protein
MKTLLRGQTSLNLGLHLIENKAIILQETEQPRDTLIFSYWCAFTVFPYDENEDISSMK